jgi:hypothetical protein
MPYILWGWPDIVKSKTNNLINQDNLVKFFGLLFKKGNTTA